MARKLDVAAAGTLAKRNLEMSPIKPSEDKSATKNQKRNSKQTTEYTSHIIMKKGLITPRLFQVLCNIASLN
jgi:hypothetical protein